MTVNLRSKNANQLEYTFPKKIVTNTHYKSLKTNYPDKSNIFFDPSDITYTVSFFILQQLANHDLYTS